MNVLKQVAKKVENSKIVKNPKFLVMGLIIIIVLITLIYFIFLKYSPIMNFKYEGYAISGKEITENLLGSSDTNKNIELTKIEEQGTIFKKLNDYFVGNKEKKEINLNYPIYINGNSSLYNLSEGSTLISKAELIGSEGEAGEGNWWISLKNDSEFDFRIDDTNESEIANRALIIKEDETTRGEKTIGEWSREGYIGKANGYIYLNLSKFGAESKITIEIKN